MRPKSTLSRFENRLFLNAKEALLFFVLLFLIAGANLTYSYFNYKNFRAEQYKNLEATILNQYIKTKNGRSYFVLKLKSTGGEIFYTTSREDLKNLKKRDITLTIVTDYIKFKDFLSSFYAPSFNLKLLPKEPSRLESIKNSIASQHEHNATKELFLALFFAEPIGKELRESITLLGIAHLIALSGYHLGVIVFIIFWLLIYPYRALQQRLFPYRNSYFDITVIAIILSFGYLAIVDFVPSLLRAFAMLLFGFFLYTRGIKILSFTFLFTTVAMLLAIKPALIMSIGFQLSILGVFFIYLILHHVKSRSNLKIFLAINSLLYPLMLPYVHYYFEPFSIMQLLSIPLTIIFSLFYPLEALLHIFGYGMLLDSLILAILALPQESVAVTTSLPLLLFFGFLAIFSIFSKKSFLLLIIVSLLYWLQGTIQFYNISWS